MTKRHEVYRCEICGNIVGVLQKGGGTLTCCNEAMTLLDENSVDTTQESHVPVIEQIAGGVRVSVGQVSHPMTEVHYIKWIEIIDKEKISRQFLSPHQKPEAIFMTDAVDIVARAYCNLHGLWKS